MSPVFRHGRLRLYLLKLLDESPRHGYEVIRLLQDRFLGVYAPSPGTIYPRLARLEEDGLVTHEEVEGRKVYSITDKGREEIRSRLSDLADLEDELTESLRDVAREISEDVRETVRGIREELTAAAREFRSQHGDRATAGASRTATADSTGPAAGAAGSTGPAAATAGGTGPAAATAGSTGPAAGGAAAAGDAAAAGAASGGTGAGECKFAADEARRIREEARRTREEMRAKFRARNRGRADWTAWSAPWSEWANASDAGPFNDLERMAMQFANELRTAARQAGNVGERSLSDLRDILTDTLAKVRVEVFTEGGGGKAAPGKADDAPREDG
jgi:DNA-binding PadR family transcriptional regulator